MPKFTFERIKAVKGPQEFDELFIDGIGQLETFKKELEHTQYQGELETIYSYMDLVASNQSVPKKKFKQLNTAKGQSKEFEFRTDNLRVYVIKKPNGKIVVLGGLKSNQEKDLRRFRSLKKQIENL